MATLNKFTGELENQLTCAICNEIFENPKMLPCLHIFCFKCIKQWKATCLRDMKRLRCPTCRASVDVEGDNINKLPSSFTITSLIDLLEAMKAKSDHDEQNQGQLPKCVSCKTASALTALCPECNGLICDSCMKNHRVMASLNNTHHPTLLTEFNKESLDSYIQRQAICKEKFHDKCHLEFYCNTCSKCICFKCSATAHSAHDKVSIEEAAENAKKLIRKDKDKLEELIAEFKKELQLSDYDMRRVENNVDAQKTKVLNNTRALKKIIQEHENAMIADLNNFLQDYKADIEKEKQEINASIENATEIKRQCETTEHDDLKHFILESQASLHNVCETTLQTKSILSMKSAKRSLSVHYIPNPEVLTQMQIVNQGKIVESVTDVSRCTIESLSSVRSGFVNRFSVATRNSEGNICSTSQEIIDVKINDGDGNDVQTKLTEAETGEFLVTYEASIPSVYRVVVKIGGRKISNSPQDVETIDAQEELKAERFIDLTEADNPISLAVSDRGEIAVVYNDHDDNHCRLALFSSDGQYLREFGGEGAGDSLLYDPFGALFIEDRILVSDYQDGCGCIKEFGIDGSFKRTVCKLPKKIISRRMCITNHGIACLSYCENTKGTCIKLFDKQTRDHLKDIKLNSTNDCRPLFIVYDNNKYFVSFFDDNMVYVYGDNGDLLYMFGGKGSKEGLFQGVGGLAVFGRGMLLVCDVNNHRVQVLTQDGEFVSSFGKHGSGLGEMHGPGDITVSPDGTVFVLELRGNRLHVWK